MTDENVKRNKLAVLIGLFVGKIANGVESIRTICRHSGGKMEIEERLGSSSVSNSHSDRFMES